jgi:hypothetical protein
MDSLLRLLLRFILVPLGYAFAVLVGLTVILIGSWKLGSALASSDSAMFAYGFFGFLVAGPFTYVMLLGMLWLPAAAGILISEVFAIRSWIFHALNGAVSAWVGWQMLENFDQSGAPLNETQYVFGAGLAAGFAYWAVAGWSAGFWKPVFARRAPPPASNPFNPPARTEA